MEDFEFCRRQFCVGIVALAYIEISNVPSCRSSKSIIKQSDSNIDSHASFNKSQLPERTRLRLCSISKFVSHADIQIRCGFTFIRS